MALPTAAPDRQLKYSRRIDVQIHARGSGLWEVHAEISDTKTRDTKLGCGVRAAGEPIHDMLLRCVVDEKLNAHATGSQTRTMPNPSKCSEHVGAYARLVSLDLVQGRRQAVRERLGDMVRCTHLTELSQVWPTATVQAVGGVVLDTREDSPSTQPPFEIDRCEFFAQQYRGSARVPSALASPVFGRPI